MVLLVDIDSDAVAGRWPGGVVNALQSKSGETRIVDKLSSSTYWG